MKKYLWRIGQAQLLAPVLAKFAWVNDAKQLKLGPLSRHLNVETGLIFQYTTGGVECRNEKRITLFQSIATNIRNESLAILLVAIKPAIPAVCIAAVCLVRARFTIPLSVANERSIIWRLVTRFVIAHLVETMQIAVNALFMLAHCRVLVFALEAIATPVADLVHDDALWPARARVRVAN